MEDFLKLKNVALEAVKGLSKGNDAEEDIGLDLVCVFMRCGLYIPLLN